MLKRTPSQGPATGTEDILRVVLVYAAFAALWILLSDKAVEWLFHDSEWITLVSTLKGWLFVACTSLLLFGLMRRMSGRATAKLTFRLTGGLRPLLALALIAVAITVLTALSIVHTFNQENKKVAAYLQTIANLKAGQIADWLRERGLDGQFVQSNRFFAQTYSNWTVAGDSASGDLLKKRLNDYREERSYQGLRLLDEHNEVLWDSEGDGSSLNTELRAAALLAAAEGKTVRVGPYRDANGRVHLDLVAPLLLVDAHHRPVVILHIDPEVYLFPTLQTWPIPSVSGETLLFRREGDDVLFLNELRYRKDTAAILRLPMAEKGLVAAQVLRGEAKLGSLIEGVDYRGVPVVGVTLSIPGTDWFLMAKMDQSELRAEANHDAIWMALTGLLAVFIAAAGFILLRQHQELTLSLRERETQAEKLRALQLLDGIAEVSNDVIFAKDREGRYLFCNKEAGRLVGKRPDELLGRDDLALFPPEQAAFIIAHDRQVMEGNSTVTFQEHLATAAGEITFLSTKGPLRDAAGNVIGMFGICRDITEQKRAEELVRIRLSLFEFATSHSLEELLQKTVDEVGVLTTSPIAFYHFVESDQKTLSFQAWSTRKLKEFCKAEGKGLHYSIDLAGVWAECVDERKPVIHNDYSALPNRKGLPEGHAPVIRELIVPIMRSDRIVAILGVGNKPTDYNDKDLEVVSYLADVAWEIAEHKRSERALSESEERLRQIIDLVPHRIFVESGDGKYLLANKAVAEAHDTSVSDITGKYHTDFHYDENELQNMLQDNWEVLTKGETKFIPEEPCTDPQGNLHFLQTTKVPFNIPGDNTPAVLGIAIDITDKRRAEEVLRENQSRLELALRSAQMGVWNLDLVEKKRHFDDQVCRLLGINPAGFSGTADEFYRAVHPGDREMLRSALARSIEQNMPHETEYRAVWPDGSVHYVTTRGKLVHDKKGQPVRMNGLLWDITERKRAEEGLRASERRLDMALAAGKMGAWEWDLTTNNLYWSPECYNIFGVTSFSGKREAFTDLVHPEDRDQLLLRIKQALQERTGYKHEFRIIQPGGSVRWVAGRGQAEYDADGKPCRLVGNTQDITERKRAEEEKEALEGKLRQAQKLEAIGTLAGGIAHDFNNILQPMMGYTEMALSELSQSNPMRGKLEQVLKASIRAKELVRQILAISRSNQEQKKTEIDLSSIVKEALKLLRSSLPTSIEVRQNIRMCVAQADATQIHQVLMNLCTNAAHAMDNEGILEVSLSPVDLSERDLADQSIPDLRPGPHLKLSVSDTGSGMDARTMERIFDPYFTTKEVGKGSGLGLAVVNGIVKRHEGAITVSSEPGKGTTFSVYIPRLETAIAVPAETPHEALIGTESILLLDDEQAVVEMGSAILERFGYKVTTETDSLRALEVFSTKPDRFDLIITDYTMPNLTGMDLAKEVRRIRPDMPVLLCTGFSEKITPESVKEFGVEVLMKPYRLGQLSDAVRKILDARKER